MRNHGYISHYEGTLRELASRGHRIFIGSRGPEKHYSVDMAASMDRLCREHPGISVHKLPRRKDRWSPLAETARSVRNYARYLHPRYAAAGALRERAAQQVFKIAGAERLPNGRFAGGVMGALASMVERSIPSDPAIEQVIEKFSPDVVVATPLVDFNSYQPEYVRAAASLGVPTVWAVASWDNLTNKGLIGGTPDRVLVWNEPQRTEAIELHGVPASRIVVTGAQTFDSWFALTASTSAAEFRRMVGLPSGPFILYLGSSPFVAPNEAAYVEKWLAALRASGHPLLERCAVLIRPHPANARQWDEVDLRPFGPVVVWPPKGDLPLEGDAKQRYFDSLHHASVVVGVNSSSMLEAGILKHRSYTLLAPEFAHSQPGTLHFEYLRRFGFVRTADTWDEHLQQLAAALEGKDALEEDAWRRMMAFIRPHGVDQPATPRVVAAIEGAALLRPARAGLSLPARLLQPLMRVLADAAARSQAARRPEGARSA